MPGPQSDPTRSLEVMLRVWSPAERPAVEALLAPAERGCYVRRTLREDLPCRVMLVVEGTAAAR